MRATSTRSSPPLSPRQTRTPRTSGVSPTATAIREAATHLFAERGYEMTTMKAIAERVGVRPSAIYNHVESKQVLLRDIAHETIRTLIEGAHSAIGSTKDETEQLRRATHLHVLMHTHERHRSHVANREIPSLQEPARTEQIVLRQEYVNIFARLIERGVAAGVFNAVAPRVTAYAILQMGIGVSIWFHEDGALTPDEVGDLYAELALRMVGRGSRVDAPLRAAHE
jgi:AcrR family transcriptional regulator